MPWLSLPLSKSYSDTSWCHAGRKIILVLSVATRAGSKTSTTSRELLLLTKKRSKTSSEQPSLVTKTRRPSRQKLFWSLPKHSQEIAKGKEAALSTMSHRLDSLDVNNSVEIFQYQHSSVSRVSAKIAYFNVRSKPNLADSRFDDTCLNGLHRDERGLVMDQCSSKDWDFCLRKDDEERRQAKGNLNMGSKRVGRFSIQPTTIAPLGNVPPDNSVEPASALPGNSLQRFQLRDSVDHHGLQELSPTSDPVNHSPHKAAPEFLSSSLGNQSEKALGRRTSTARNSTSQESLERPKRREVDKNLGKLLVYKELRSRQEFSTSADNNNNNKLVYKEPRNRQEFSSYFLHFATPRPFYRAYSFIWARLRESAKRVLSHSWKSSKSRKYLQIDNLSYLIRRGGVTPISHITLPAILCILLLGPPFWFTILVYHFGPPFWSIILVHHFGPQFWSTINNNQHLLLRANTFISTAPLSLQSVHRFIWSNNLLKSFWNPFIADYRDNKCTVWETTKLPSIPYDSCSDKIAQRVDGCVVFHLI